MYAKANTENAFHIRRMSSFCETVNFGNLGPVEQQKTLFIHPFRKLIQIVVLNKTHVRRFFDFREI